jgi:thiol-disulfide isomerase/thioredoxin
MAMIPLVMLAAVGLAPSGHSGRQPGTDIPRVASIVPASADEPVKPQLTVGSKAPPLTVAAWVRGDPIAAIEPGTVGIVEFFATWCVPCRRSMPRLSALTNKYGPQGLRVIGVASNEPRGEPDVRDFVSANADRIAYSIAWDADGRTTTAWMTASGNTSIPMAFVVDRTGAVAWLGNPLYPAGEFERAVEQVVAGTYDMEAAKATAAKRALDRKAADEILARLDEAWQMGKQREAMDLVDRAMAVDPIRLAPMGIDKFVTLAIRLNDPDAAYAYARTLVDKTFKDDPALLAALASKILEHPGLARRDVDLALAAATRAQELSKTDDPGVLDALARAHFDKGDAAKAVEFQQRAIAAAEDEPTRELLRKRLERYTSAK